MTNKIDLKYLYKTWFNTFHRFSTRLGSCIAYFAAATSSVSSIKCSVFNFNAFLLIIYKKEQHQILQNKWINVSLLRFRLKIWIRLDFSSLRCLLNLFCGFLLLFSRALSLSHQLCSALFCCFRFWFWRREFLFLENEMINANRKNKGVSTKIGTKDVLGEYLEVCWKLN